MSETTVLPTSDPHTRVESEREADDDQRLRATTRTGWFFEESPLDAILIAVSLVHTAALVGSIYYFEYLSIWGLTAVGVLSVFLTCTNYQCTAHNFIHTPFFRSVLLNHLFSVVNSLSLGMPQTLYRYHHLNHHKYNCDYRDPATGTTWDYSSIYRFSKAPKAPESIWTYSLLGPLRIDFVVLYKKATERRLGWLVAVESLCVVAFYAGLALWDWFAFATFLAPVLFLGQAAALAQNYLEHKGAVPGNRLTDSVSCYNSTYNLLWFNNGYHQEHHFRPYVHWTKVSSLRSLMLPEEERRVVPGTHLSNLFSRGGS